MSMFLGLFGSIIILVGWFGFQSEIAIIVGIGLYVLETILEWEKLNASAKAVDVFIFFIGFSIGLFIDTPAWICGLIAVSIYSLLMGLVTLPMMVAQIKGFYKFSSSYGSYPKPQKRKTSINQNANSSEVRNNVFHTDIEAVKREIKNVKNGNRGFLSYAQIAEIIINMDDMRKNLPPDKIQAVHAYYTKLQNNNQIYEMSKMGYAHCCLEIINGFEAIVAPSYKDYCKIIRDEMISIINSEGHNKSEAKKDLVTSSTEFLQPKQPYMVKPIETENKNGYLKIVSPAATNVSVAEKKDPIKTVKSSDGSMVKDNSIEVQFHLLEKLSELHNKGILTDEEYSSKKREILDRL